MTHSGQGDEPRNPAARPAHEGVVLPSDGSGPWIPGSAVDQNQAATPSYGPPRDAPYGAHEPGSYGDAGNYGDAGGYGGAGAHAQPPSYPQPGQQPGQADPYGQPYQHGQQPLHQPYEPHQPHQSYPQQGGLPEPYQQPGAQAQPYQQPQRQPYEQLQPQSPPYQQPGQQPGYGASYPSASLPPEVPAPGSADATQYLPPIPAAPPGGDADATQFIAPVPAGPGPLPSPGPGMLPPESSAEATQFLPPTAAHGSDADATQFIAPVPATGPAPYDIRPGTPGERPPPAEFDNLFRTDGGADQGGGGAESTQQMPQFDAAGPAPRGHAQPPGAQPYASARRKSSRDDGAFEPQGRGAVRRKSSRAPVIAAAAIGLVVLGLGAGALMSGGDDDAKQDDSKTVASASTPTPEASASSEPAEDPVKTQAVELDKLLADSSSSRESVIKAVDDIKSCRNLDRAADDLHAAAEQRRGLVTRLEALTVDKLPSHSELTSSLTDAWEASASADDHYASWADQVGGKKGCKGGHARVTGQAAKGNKASGEATAAKQKASGLWNGIAKKYELTERAPTQL
ncbi:hypothetical protein [Streptomyces corynorhini]|uniref:Uncharacterized protein n=1 Tax=Streptomyces corynorhini TaxID=2282652 RepID=A0A370B799_9ACTN|nr:hypothetical protein [Streptomyces corynorhini]RDG35703.1 hypothetical protein DVH02_23870 [Streptomyces corynorhini]